MKVLVHLHLFYQDMLPEMLTLLRSLDGYEYDLFATVVNASPETLAELRRFKPEVTVIDVETAVTTSRLLSGFCSWPI